MSSPLKVENIADMLSLQAEDSDQRYFLDFD